MPQAALSRSEQSYIVDGLNARPPHRHDGRGLTDFRPLVIDSEVADRADGSAVVQIGATEVLVGVKAEIEQFDAPEVSISDGEKTEKYRPRLPPTPRIQCAVEYSPALLRDHTTIELSMVQAALEDMLAGCFSLSGDSLGPFDVSQFIVVPHAKYWLLHLDVVVNSWGGGNVLDTVFSAVFCALWNTRIPQTQVLRMQAPKGSATTAGDEADPAGVKYLTRSSARTQADAARGVDFALQNEWMDGSTLRGRDSMPVCITIYPVRDAEHHHTDSKLEQGYLLDPTLEEETALRASVAVLAAADGRMYGVQQRGAGDLAINVLQYAIEVGIGHAKELATELVAQCE